MELETLMVDMDDVICKGGFLYLINKYLGSHYQESDFNNFYMQDIIPNKEDFFKWFREKNMYDYCELLPGAYVTLRELNQYYRLYIGTSFIFPEMMEDSGYIVWQKYDYLRKNLPFISPTRYIFLTDKNILNCHIKIDDRLDNLEVASRKILFSAYHNRNISDNMLDSMGIERVNDWFDVKNKLLKR